MSAFLVFILIIFIVFVFTWMVYNQLIKQKNLISEAWAALDVTLKKRHDLIPNLIEVVKGISDHEKEIFTEVTKWRSKAMNRSNSNERETAENHLSSALGQISVVIENYPNLVSGPNYLKLQDQLFEIEDEISYARRYYNGTIRNNRILIESFPSNLIANLFNFEKSNFFEIEISSEKQAPQLNFNDEE